MKDFAKVKFSNFESKQIPCIAKSSFKKNIHGVLLLCENVWVIVFLNSDK